LLAVAGEDGEAWVLGESGIGEREIAQDEDRAARGFEAASVEAIGAEANTQGVMRLLPRIRHENKDSAVRGRHGFRMKC